MWLLWWFSACTYHSSLLFIITFNSHEQINFGPSQKKWEPNEERINKFVFIGKGLDRAELTKGLMECLYKEDGTK